MAPKKDQKQIYYKIGEACKLLDIQPYVLRYWETEFPELSPNKSRSGQRVYSEDELALIRRIKELLYDEGFTIEGARARLRELGHDEGPAPLPPPSESEVSNDTLRKIKQGHTDLIRICAD